MIGWLGMPELASAHGAEIDRTMVLVHALMAALFIGWLSFFVLALVRFGRSRRAVASGGVRGHTSTYLEIAVAVAEGILLIGFSIPAWARRVAQFPPEDKAEVVRVVAEQFAWNVHYPGPDGVFGRTDVKLIDPVSNPLGLDRTDPAAKDDITTINQLHVVVNRPVIVRLSSKDVIHSFALQEMRVKQDVIPGLSTPVWFVPTVTTDEMRQIKHQPDYNYEISCAQLCGLGHFRMRGYLTVDTEEQFKAWIDRQEADLKGTDEDSVWK